ncbi:MAG: hypothetical protein MUE61_18825 [Vicinamibacterales bacterium]|jgi:hypothetical protein|nr:hypothetical protein [Vicinamibacterales bacterium]
MRIRAPYLCVLVLLLTAPALVHAQLGGLLKKKAAEALKAKPTPPAPTPAPTPAPGTASKGEPNAPATAPTSEPKAPASPLDISDSDLTNKANQVLRELLPDPERGGDWERLPYIGGRVVAAAKALDESARLAFVEKVGGAFKTLVMSDTFGKAYADSIKQEHEAVDHGITGLVSMEELLKRKNFAAVEARNNGESAAVIVDNMESENAKTLQLLISQNLESWTRNAENVNRKDRAKYQKMVRDAQALQALGTSDLQKLRRGVAVLYSMDRGGPDTEEALYALRDRVKLESEQLAWDQYNLKTVLKNQLTAFVALVPTVDFEAATKEEEGMVRFVKPAYERKGQVWKACFRAGKPVSMSAMQMAQAWLKEL